MNVAGVLFMLGRLLLALAAALLAPAAVAWAYGGPDLGAFLLSAALTGAVGAGLEWRFRQRGEFRFGREEAVLLVTAAWFTSAVAGALPFVLVKGPSFWVNALFESASGFTTTGASILTDVEAEPAGILLWRALTQWIGGMGIIVLGIAILPRLAVGGMELLGAEAPGPIKEKLTPRIAQTAKALWGIYVMLTILESGALAALGLEPLDAVGHAFATMATGGFSTRNLSVGAFADPAVEMVVTGFMLAAGANFALHFQLLRGRPRLFVRDPELRLYVSIVAVATLVVAFDLRLRDHVASIVDALRLAVFQVTSVVTTTGFGTDDFGHWPVFSRAVLFALLFVGGCAGSTGGSIKVVRHLIVFRKLVVDVKRLVQPHAVLPVRLGERAIPDSVVSAVTTFALLYVGLFLAGGMALVTTGVDMETAFSASAACLGNVGPGFGGVGPAGNYAALSSVSKLVLTVQMIVGRLELYTVFVVFFLRRRR